jgi:hypothetical protein
MKIKIFHFRSGRNQSSDDLQVSDNANAVFKSFKKKDIRKILMTPFYFNGILLCLLSLVTFTFVSASCEKPTTINTTQSDDPALQTTQMIDSCQWQVIQSLALDSIIETKLNQLFSNQNLLLPPFNDDSTLYLIDNQYDFSLICNDSSVITQIDFSKFCIVWGMYQAPAIPYTISAKELFFCPDNISYKYNIYIQKCTECYSAIETLYYWGIYPIINQNVLLNINILHK